VTRKPNGSMSRQPMTEVEIESDAYTLPIETVVKRLASLAGVVVTGIIGNASASGACGSGFPATVVRTASLSCALRIVSRT